VSAVCHAVLGVRGSEASVFLRDDVVCEGGLWRERPFGDGNDCPTNLLSAQSKKLP